MIIDMHVHLMSTNLIAKPFWDSLVKLYSSLSGKAPEEVEKMFPSLWDDTGELLLKDMDEAGIDQSWLCVLDFGLTKGIGEAHYAIGEINKKFARISAESGGRVLAFAGCDPRRQEAVSLLETAVRQWGMRGLKLLPACGYYPNDENCYKLYRKADELGIPVIIHTGPEAIPLYSKYCYPIFLDEVANDFPQLKLIMAHAGFCWWEEALSVAHNKPNLYLDLSGWQPRLLHHPREEFYLPLRRILDGIGPSRVMFGSDWPAYRKLRGGQASWVRIFKNLAIDAVQYQIRFTEEEIAAMLGDSAAELMNGN